MLTIILQFQEILEIWRGGWKNFIVPPLNGIYLFFNNRVDILLI